MKKIQMDNHNTAPKYTKKSNTSSLTLKQLEIRLQVERIEAIAARALLELQKLEKDLEKSLKQAREANSCSLSNQESKEFDGLEGRRPLDLEGWWSQG